LLTITDQKTLVGILRRRAAELPEHVAYRFLGDGETESHQLSYAALDRQARAIAARMEGSARRASRS
jgi:acyl-CoA synthetase (AMP-forming)/AMP-acid ligase II